MWFCCLCTLALLRQTPPKRRRPWWWWHWPCSVSTIESCHAIADSCLIFFSTYCVLSPWLTLTKNLNVSYSCMLRILSEAGQAKQVLAIVPVGQPASRAAWASYNGTYEVFFFFASVFLGVVPYCFCYVLMLAKKHIQEAFWCTNCGAKVENNQVFHGHLVHWWRFRYWSHVSDSDGCSPQDSCHLLLVFLLSFCQCLVLWEAFVLLGNCLHLRFGFDLDWRIGRACDIAKHSRKFLGWFQGNTHIVTQDIFSFRCAKVCGSQFSGSMHVWRHHRFCWWHQEETAEKKAGCYIKFWMFFSTKDNKFECFFHQICIMCFGYHIFLYWAWGMSSKVSSVYCLTHDKKCMRKALHSPASHQKCATDGPPCVLFSKSLGGKLKITTFFFNK